MYPDSIYFRFKSNLYIGTLRPMYILLGYMESQLLLESIEFKI